MLDSNTPESQATNAGSAAQAVVVKEAPKEGALRPPQKGSLNEAIASSKDPEVQKLASEIEAVKKERIDAIIRIKSNRRRRSYKEAEGIAVAKILAAEKDKPENEAKKRKIGYLKKMKSSLEFRISTEARNLEEEKGLVRKIGEINAELDEAYKLVRLDRKGEFIKGDIEECNKNIKELEEKIAAYDKRLDELYDSVRKKLRVKREYVSREWGAPQQARRRPQQVSGPAPQQINLEDIVVIKKKEKKAQEEEA